MKQHKITLTLRKISTSLACAGLLCSALLNAGAVNGQKTENQPRTSGTAAKMKNVPQTAADRDADSPEYLSDPRSGVIAKATVRQNKAGQVLQVDGEIPVSGASSVRDAADKFLNINADKLGIVPLVRSRDDKTGLKVVSEVKSLTGTHITYKQFYNNLPVFDEQLKVSVDNKLQITNVTHDVQPVPDSRDLDEKPISEATAIKTAVAAVKGTVDQANPLKAELGIVMSKQAEPTTVYSVSVLTENPAAEWIVRVNAVSNEVISVRNIAQYQSPVSQTVQVKARIFVPNPVNSSGINDLADNNNSEYPQLAGQMKIVSLRDLDATGSLSGTYANTLPTKNFVRAKTAANGYIYPRSDARFDEVMAYYWVTEATHYVHDLGFTNVLTRSLSIDVDGITDDNSFYSPGRKQLTFGSGGVHDAQDASIVLHETGHAILDSQVPGFGGPGTEAGAIGEGFGDYFAASYFAGTGVKGSLWDAYVGTWDAVTYNPGSPAFLRRLDGNKHYPEDLDANMEVHNNGEMWSANLWEIRQNLGKKAADTLIIESHFKLSPTATFRDNALAIIATDKELNGGKNAATLQRIFSKRGILSGGTAVSTVSTGGAVGSITNQKWTGSDTGGLKYEYGFTGGGTANVKVTFQNGENYTDSAAKYTLAGNQISINAFSGVIAQTGTISGSQISGRCTITTDKKSAEKISKAFESSGAGKQSNTYNWTASSGGGTAGTNVSVMNQRWTGGDTGGLKYEYSFTGTTGVNVKVTFQNGENYTDSAAKYQITGSQIKITAFSGVIVQDGTISGNSISGRSTITTKDKTSKKISKAINKSPDLSKSDSYNWTASR